MSKIPVRCGSSFKSRYLLLVVTSCFALSGCGNFRYVKGDWANVGKGLSQATCERYRTASPSEFVACQKDLDRTYEELRTKQTEGNEKSASGAAEPIHGSATSVGISAKSSK